MTKHWSEVLACSCGMRFRTTIAEAQHRHNFPAMCRKPRAKKEKRNGITHEGHKGLNTQSTKEGVGS